MQRPKLVHIWIICVLFVASSCGIKKYIPEGHYLLEKNELEIEKPYNKETKRQLEKYYKQKPNKRLLFIFKSRPYFYAKGSQGNDNWFKRFERNTLGEQPVIIDTLFIDATIRSMNNYLRSIGYYYANIDYNIKGSKRKKATVTYYVTPNNQYKFGDINLQVADKAVYDLVKQNMKESFIQTGRGLDQGNLLKEQERLINLLRNNGYYLMNKEFIDFDIDTNMNEGYAKVGVNIRNPADEETHKKYYNNDLTVEITPNQASKRKTSTIDTLHTTNFTYIPNRFLLKPYVLDKNILLVQGREFRQLSLNRTYSRMADLGLFRFVNIQSTPTIVNDSGFINYHIRLIPTNKYDFTFEPQLTTSDQNNTLTAQDERNYGIAFLTQLTNRNIFHSAEIFNLSLRSAFEAQGQINRKGLFNSTEQRLTASITIPRTLFMPSFDRNERFINTKTVFTAAGIYEINRDYQRQVFTTGIIYHFNKPLISYYFAPLEFSYIRSNIVSDTLKEQAKTDVFLQNLFSNNVILSSKFGFVYSNKTIAKGPSFYSLKWDVIEFGGNLLNAISRAIDGPKDANGNYTVLGVRYFQYLKTAIDFRYNTVYDDNNKSAFRLFAGYGLPYGNSSDFLPFEKRFFVGGANDLRGWAPRSIGPGSYYSPTQLDYSGEIKLAFNAEYRFNIYNRWFEGAVFTDMGNIWIARPNTSMPNADFKWTRFYKELAIDAGFGTRFNFDIIIIRFDFAIPLRDPTYTEDSRWVIKNFNGNWFFQNLNFNFGIGYPF